MSRIVYATAVFLNTTSAQSKQIASMARAFHNLDCNFRLISPHPMNYSDLKPARWWLGTPQISNRLLRLLSICFVLFKQPNDAIYYTRDILLALFLTLNGKKVAYEIHKPFQYFLSDQIFKRLSKKIPIIAISQGLKDFLVKKLNIFENSILVAHSAVSEDFLTRSTPPKKWNNRIKVVYTGNLNPERGIKLIEKIACEYKNLDFNIYGEIGSSFANTFAPENMKYMGYTKPENIPSILSESNILIMPYTAETKTIDYMSPLKMFEYMSSLRPIIAPRIGTIPEVLNDNNAYLYSHEDEIFDLLDSCLSNQNLANLKAYNAFKTVEDKYTWEKRSMAIYDFITAWPWQVDD